jgi:hypothetical protein
LTGSLPSVIERYEQEVGLGTVQHIVVDREGMAAEFLAALKEAGRTAISVLRTDQYAGIDSFTDIGPFVPLRVSKHGEVLREVAPASIALPLPEHKGQVLPLRVALIRDLRRHVPVPPTKEEQEYPRRWDADVLEDWRVRKTIKEEKTIADAEIEEYQQRQWKAYETSNQEHRKCERYCQEQRQLLRALEDLKAQERTMYELDNNKDQVMTVFKVALVNLVMWTRDRYFPASYAHATWKRLAPFFHLPGVVMQGQDTVTVALRPFNDKRYNQDLEALCERINAAAPRLPDGRCLHFSTQVTKVMRPILDMQKR